MVGQLDVPLRGDGRQGCDMARQLRAEHYLNQRLRCAMAIAGHDLRQPLQVISAVLERFARDEQDIGRQLRLDIALEETARLSEGLEQLAFASSHKAGIPPRAIAFSIEELMQDVAGVWRFTAAAKGLSLKVVPTRRHVWTDPDLLRAAFVNLVGNAVKYTASGGLVVGCRREGDTLALCVIDSGPGVPADEIGHVFDEFTQGDPAQSGLGLGLSIVRNVAELLGLGARVNSKVGRGSCFAITQIPMMEP
jgi:signal transduction histidine kinase